MSARRASAEGAKAFDACRSMMIGLSKKTASDLATPRAARLTRAFGNCASVKVTAGSPNAIVTSLKENGRNCFQSEPWVTFFSSAADTLGPQPGRRRVVEHGL